MALCSCNAYVRKAGTEYAHLLLTSGTRPVRANSESQVPYRGPGAAHFTDLLDANQADGEATPRGGWC